MNDIHVYEYDGGSMPGIKNGYFEIYEGEYGDGEFFIQADNSNVFELAKTFADSRNANIIFHTIANYYAMSDPYGRIPPTATKEN